MSPRAWNAPAAATARAATVCVSWLPALIPSPWTHRLRQSRSHRRRHHRRRDGRVTVTVTVAGGKEVVEVSSQAELVETSRSSTTDTIGQRRIDNLPINGRNYINFTLTDSQVLRDNAPNTGAAPTSGLNISGQRARSNLVNVDGADATDNAVNGVRSTVSQEAVQEFQIITNSYAAEYGRASGGVVNIITRSGSNDFHGDVYGYLRNRNFQAVNPFSTTPNPAYTRVQGGVAFGGPIKKDKTYYYFAYETTRRHETGFSSIGQGNFGLTGVDVSPIFGAPAGFFPNIQATPDQAAFLTANEIPDPTVQLYAFMVGASSGIAVNGSYPAWFANLPPTLVPAGLQQFPSSCNPSFASPSRRRSLLLHRATCILPDLGFAGRQLPRLRRHQRLLASHRPQCQQQQPPDAPRQRQSEHRYWHRSQRTRSALRTKCLLAHFSTDLS